MPHPPHGEPRHQVLTSDLGPQDNGSSEEDEPERVALVLHPGSAGDTDPGHQLLLTARGVREVLRTLAQKVAELEKQQSTILATPLPEDGMKRDLQRLREEIRELAKDVQARLKAMEPKKGAEDENHNTVAARMRRTQHGILFQQFQALINQCNASQSAYRDRNVERIQRQLQITGGGVVSDEELEQMLETGQTEVFVSNIMKDTRVTKQALNEIETRHGEILKLERSIQELHDMFTYLATEVELQGEMIDRVEKNILDSEDYVHKGHQHLAAARESQHKARKKKVMIAICLSLTVVIIIIIIGVAISTG
ncbi:syntaxin-4 [Alligator mississippiensis]|uniref:Syntaxin-4 n=1 Tax=Alligator mississippiensis TaxID=8496 RepID=A0A151NWA8_ALLMI|nr:syntaxin-4 [Alligator mississippiensis]